MRYLDKQVVADDVAWALFGYLSMARDFYTGNPNDAKQCAWIRKHALQSRGMYGYFANEILMSDFPWSKELCNRAKSIIASSDGDPFVLAGTVKGLIARLHRCTRMKKYGQTGYPLCRKEHQQKKLIPAQDLQQLAEVVSQNFQGIVAVKDPLGAFRPDVRNLEVELLYYLGILEPDSSAGKELLGYFAQRAPIGKVMELFAVANGYLGDYARGLFPVLCKRYGNVIFSRMQNRLSHCEVEHVLGFVTAYFALPSISEKDKAQNRIIWEQISGLGTKKTNK